MIYIQLVYKYVHTKSRYSMYSAWGVGGDRAYTISHCLVVCTVQHKSVPAKSGAALGLKV